MQNYFHTDDERTLLWLENVFVTARRNGWPVRLFTENGNLKVKVNHGVWTPPIASTPDSYRDAPVEILTSVKPEGTCNAHVDVHHFRNDPDPCIGWRDYP